MKTKARYRTSAALSLSTLLLTAAFPQDRPAAPAQPYTVESAVDWEARVLKVRVTLDLGAAGLRLPAGRLEAERVVERDLPALSKDALFDLRVDSMRDVRGTIADGTLPAELILSLPKAARRASSSLTKNLGGYTAGYELPLDTVAGLYTSGASPPPMLPPVDIVPTRAYTGIIIYAKGELPVHGEKTTGRAVPCLFPRIYDQTMRLILDKNVTAPETLASGGMLAYTEAVGVESWPRVGGDPLRVMALEIFGEGRTDYIISRDDAQKILSSAENRDLLRLGKVVVVLDL
jgi:hypothetical protein